MNTTTTSLSRRLAAVGLVALVGLAACGSDDDDADTTEAPAESADVASTDAATDTSDSGTSDAGTSDSEAAGITITGAWSREPAEGQTTSAVYGVVTNGTDAAITAIGATSPVSDTLELHEVVMNDEGQMSMREKEGGYTIEAGDSLTFEPGGAHIMVLGIDPATYPDEIEVTLEFDNGETLAFTAEVRPLDTSGMDMGADDGEMDMDDSETSDTGDSMTDSMEDDG